jgi:hypothetical protein
LAPQTVARFKARVRELTRRTRGRSLARIIEELSRYLKGCPARHPMERPRLAPPFAGRLSMQYAELG